MYDIEEIVTQHVPGKLNEVADKLSRMAQPGASQLLPPKLHDAKRRVTPKRNDAFFRSWLAAVGPSSNFDSVCEKSFTSLFINETVCGNAGLCAETPALVSSVKSFEFLFCQSEARWCCVFLRSVQTISLMLVLLVSTPRRRHKEEEDWRLGTQSTEVHVVKELRLGADW